MNSNVVETYSYLWMWNLAMGAELLFSAGVFARAAAKAACMRHLGEPRSIQEAFAMSSIQRYRFVQNPRPGTPNFIQHDASVNQALRSHPEKPLKNRASEERFPCVLVSDRLEQAPASRQFAFELSPRKPIKGIGYSSKANEVATTGTSQAGVLCLTDGLGPCVAVALAAEHSDGKAKARIFHIAPHNHLLPVARYVKQMEKDGYEVRAALHGGDNDEPVSRRKADEVRALLRGLGVPVQIEDTGGGMDGNGSLGAVVEDDGTARFVMDVVPPK
ncbi:XopAF/AvrXv3 family type III secretion system effector [Paracidovorax anthurii]|nr:XopAF/AvrXv3 family type III secretion system effector [Paracidovorax anthurii]